MIVAAVMFRVAFPELVSVTFWVALLPTFTLLKVTDEGLIPICACVAVPDPLKLILSGEPGAVLVIEMVPVTLPGDVGPNVTVKGAVCPGVRVCGDNPLILKPVPVTLLAEIDRLAVPEFVSVTATDAVLPSRTLPKLMLEGLAASEACVPVPVNEMVRLGLVAVDVIVMLPEAVPVPVGAKAAVSDAVAPAAIVCPALIPLALKPDPVVLT